MLTFASAKPGSKENLGFTKSVYADVSISYLAKTDLPLLMAAAEEMPLLVAAMLSMDAGVIVAIPTEGDLLEWQLNKAKSMGFSNQFLAIIAEAACQDIQYVRFDVEGGFVRGIKTLQGQLQTMLPYKPFVADPEEFEALQDALDLLPVSA